MATASPMPVALALLTIALLAGSGARLVHAVTTEEAGCAYLGGVHGLQHLDCSARGLTGTLELDDIKTSTKTITFAGNSLAGVAPGSFAGLTHLVSVDYSGNPGLQLSCATSGCTWQSLGCIDADTELVCSGRRLFGAVWITNVPSDTTVIRFDRNDITTIDPRTYEGLDDLERVHLEGNPSLVNECAAGGCLFQSLGCFYSSSTSSDALRYIPKPAFPDGAAPSVLRCDSRPGPITGDVWITNARPGTTHVNFDHNDISRIDARSFAGLDDLSLVSFDFNSNLDNTCPTDGCKWQAIGCHYAGETSGPTLYCHTGVRAYHGKVGVAGTLRLVDLPPDTQEIRLYGHGIMPVHADMLGEGQPAIRQYRSGPNPSGNDVPRYWVP